MAVYELANVAPLARQAYVGRSAFAHKGGLHVSGIQRNVRTYEHIDPSLVGNDRRVLLSELAGRSNILYKAKEFGINIKPDNQKVGGLLEELKRLEGEGYVFDGADASFELVSSCDRRPRWSPQPLLGDRQRSCERSRLGIAEGSRPVLSRSRGNATR